MARPLVAGKPSNGKKPYKKYGGDRNLAYMTAMFEAFQKGKKKTGKSKKCKKCTYNSSHDFNSAEESG